MIVLAIDTALDVCSAALLRNGSVLGRGRAPDGVSRSDALAPLIAALLDQTELGSREIDRIGAVIGPGGFAGIRAGLSFARAFAFAIGSPVIGVDTMTALAASESDGGRSWTAPLVDARRGQVYAALFDPNGLPALGPFVADVEDALARLTSAARAPVSVFGTGAPLLPALPDGWKIRHERAEIDVAAVARLTAQAVPSDGPPSPLYLRPPDAIASAASLFDGLIGPAQ